MQCLQCFSHKTNIKRHIWTMLILEKGITASFLCIIWHRQKWIGRHWSPFAVLSMVFAIDQEVPSFTWQYGWFSWQCLSIFCTKSFYFITKIFPFWIFARAWIYVASITITPKKRNKITVKGTLQALCHCSYAVTNQRRGRIFAQRTSEHLGKSKI
jgi:hypothetical protein